MSRSHELVTWVGHESTVTDTVNTRIVTTINVLNTKYSDSRNKCNPQ